MWDVSVLAEVVPSHLHGTATEVGSATMQADQKKME